jgi:hypothetical protein
MKCMLVNFDVMEEKTLHYKKFLHFETIYFWLILNKLFNSTLISFSFSINSFIFLYCCDEWRDIVAFTHVLTIYQIYHT